MHRLRMKFFQVCAAFLLFAVVSGLEPDSSSTTEAIALLAFKSKADLSDNLRFYAETRSAYCKWQGVSCFQGEVIRFVLGGITLGGVFGDDTLMRLPQLRVLSLQNLSLTGPIPDLSALTNLKALFLDHNSFSGHLQSSLSSLHRLRTLDLSFNELAGEIPFQLVKLDQLANFRLENNAFSGIIPPFNQSSLRNFNVSVNNLTGAVPVTLTLSKLGASAFSLNPGLCGEILKKECHPREAFFNPSLEIPAASPEAMIPRKRDSITPRRRKSALVVVFFLGIMFLICSLACIVVWMKRKRKMVMQVEEVEEVKKSEVFERAASLVFCAGEDEVFSLDELMRASAELLGRGRFGTTYKAVLGDRDRSVVAVKRLAAPVRVESFEEVGRLRHPNLVPLRAYFRAGDERLIVYEYQHNGSLFSLLHGSRSVRAKPLHWTSCLKIAEDVAQGLAYIHQAWRLIHGNLKSTNVLLGSDFEACLVDYCLVGGEEYSGNGEEYSGYDAPEIRKVGAPETAASDVYSFGVLLIELLTGELPSRHPPATGDVTRWVRAVRASDRREDGKMGMLLEVAVACRAAAPDRRPSMWQVLKTLQQIKEVLLLEESESALSS